MCACGVSLWGRTLSPSPAAQRAGIEFVTHIMQELNRSLFYLQSRIEEIKLLYLIFNGKIYSFPPPSPPHSRPFYVSSRLDRSIRINK